MEIKATVSAWAREEEGGYHAEINGWKLAVEWHPEPPKGGDYGFSWHAEGPGGEKVKGEGLVEEPEMAMMLAEGAISASAKGGEGEESKGDS